MVLEHEKELILQEQIEVSNTMPQPPGLKILWKHGAIQFGYVFFFLVSFPATALICIFFNVVHINGLYMSFTGYIKRKPSVERNSIGVWNKIFFILTFLALLINMAMLMFSSNGAVELIEHKFNYKINTYTLIVILVMVEHVTLLLKMLLSLLIRKTPKWVENILKERNDKQQKHHEKLKAKYTLNKQREVFSNTKGKILDQVVNKMRKSIINGNKLEAKTINSNVDSDHMKYLSDGEDYNEEDSVSYINFHESMDSRDSNFQSNEKNIVINPDNLRKSAFAQVKGFNIGDKDDNDGSDDDKKLID